MQTDKVQVRKEGGVAYVTFNDPKRRNPLSLEVMQATTRAFRSLAEDPDVRVIASTGAGPDAYIGGLDVRELATVWRGADSPEPVFLDFVSAIRDCPKLTLAVVNGFCLGGGITILLAHDLAIAADTAQIGLPEVFRGFTPRYATGALFKAVLPRVAFEMMLTGRNIGGQRAVDVGLVNRVTAPDRLAEEARAWAQELARFDPVTVAFCKKGAYEALDQPTYAGALRASSQVHLACNAANPKSFEGLLAFVEGRGEKATR